MENSNRLIAEFMGMTPCLTDEGDFLIKGNPIEAKYLPYTTSWDWLMPVVIKIGGGSNILGAMRDLRPYSLIRNLEDTYEAVVEFIKNQNN